MTRLRKMMLEELQRRNFAETTIDCYIRAVEESASNSALITFTIRYTFATKVQRKKKLFTFSSVTSLDFIRRAFAFARKCRRRERERKTQRISLLPQCSHPVTMRGEYVLSLRIARGIESGR